MSIADIWADAIGAERDIDGQPLLGTVLAHIRSAVIEAGYVSHGRITSGLKEAYRPLRVDETKLRNTIDEALRLLLLSGDFDEFSTGAGRGYAATSPRCVSWGGPSVVQLGATYGGNETGLVRHIASDESAESTITIPLAVELGRPEWRSALVDLNAADVLDDDVGALFGLASTLAASGERYSLDEPFAVAVLSGRGRFFGRPENAPSGRWQRVMLDGCFPAVIKSGFISRYVVLNVANGEATLWQPDSRDLWHWIVVGATVSIRDPVISYDQATQRLDFLTPPPRQIERAVLLTSTRIGPWSWKVDGRVYSVITELMTAAR
uniref:Uncharacterized protein n=1 Tax=Rhodopseudomonas palustris (strain BisA53) TaxID=316055 RepID=Q07PM5_RHOP5